MVTTVAPPPYFSADAVDVGELAELVATTTPPGAYPHATEIVREVVVYDMPALARVVARPDGRREVMGELAHALREGPGVIALRGAVGADVLDRVTTAFEWMIADEHQAGLGAGDHFAEAGANDRVWNALEKLAVAEPEAFVDYYGSDAIALAATAWLGPAYQITSQVNVVRPGGVAQSPHRDYHLGFMTSAEAERFPAHAHLVSSMLTLQGAVAHSDMPVESGPTKLLPHSHKFAAGYVAWRRRDVIELFEERCAQLPLAAGDALFFSPAVLHAAGSNRTAQVRRIANLLQVSSAFGRSMESVDRTRMLRAVYPVLRARRTAGDDAAVIERAIAAAAEGYAFPTNLDRDPPIGGLAPASQADIVRQALTDDWTSQQLDDALTALETRHRTH